MLSKLAIIIFLEGDIAKYFYVWVGNGTQLEHDLWNVYCVYLIFQSSENICLERGYVLTVKGLSQTKLYSFAYYHSAVP